MLKNLLLQELSQFLVALGDRSEETEEQEFHEPDLQQADLEAFFDCPCKYARESKEPWTTSNREKTMEPEIAESLASFPLCKSQVLEDL
jgi:hypothetical protein